MSDNKALHKSIEHRSTVVVTNDDSELFYVLKWCERKGKSVSGWMKERVDFPFCVSVHGDVVGWTDLMDRALYYKSFNEFLTEISPKHKTKQD